MSLAIPTPSWPYKSARCRTVASRLNATDAARSMGSRLGTEVASRAAASSAASTRAARARSCSPLRRAAASSTSSASGRGVSTSAHRPRSAAQSPLPAVVAEGLDDAVYEVPAQPPAVVAEGRCHAATERVALLADEELTLATVDGAPTGCDGGRRPIARRVSVRGIPGPRRACVDLTSPLGGARWRRPHRLDD